MILVRLEVLSGVCMLFHTHAGERPPEGGQIVVAGGQSTAPPSRLPATAAS